MANTKNTMTISTNPKEFIIAMLEAQPADGPRGSYRCMQPNHDVLILAVGTSFFLLGGPGY